MTSLGTIELGAYTDISSTTPTGSDPLLENIAGADDADFAGDATNSTHTGIASFALNAVPADLGNVNSIAINVRYGGDAFGADKTWDTLSVQIVKSDGSTALTDDTTIASNITDITPAESGATTLTNPDTAANKTDWEGALVRFSFAATRAKGGETDEYRVYAAEVTGDYTISTGPDIPATMYHYMHNIGSGL